MGTDNYPWVGLLSFTRLLSVQVGLLRTVVAPL